MIGFGAQGHAHALNLRDSGFEVVVGLRRASKSRPLARAAKLPVFETAEATERSDVLFLALPDTRMPAVFEREIAPSLRAGQTLLFAHGFAVHYRTVVPPREVDVVMVAPKALGPMMRREYEAGRGVPALVAVAQDFTGGARATALAWAKGVGCGRAGIIETSFREETETDLFGEQAVLCGGTTALIQAGFETLVNAGYAPELAYFECLYELKFIVDMIHEQGLTRMRERISDTALFGDLMVGPMLVNASTRERMRKALKNIRSGAFARALLREVAQGNRDLRECLRRTEASEIERVGRRLRAGLSWRQQQKPHHRRS